MLVWETIVVKSNWGLLARHSSSILKFEKGNSVFILGGIDNQSNPTNHIVEFELYSRKASPCRKTLEEEAEFSQQMGSDLNKFNFYLFDDNNSIHKVLGNDFQVLL